MFEWIQDNKDWLFSGAALIIIPAIYRSFKTQFNKLLPAKFKLKLFSAETLILFAIICILSGWLIHSLVIKPEKDRINKHLRDFRGSHYVADFSESIPLEQIDMNPEKFADNAFYYTSDEPFLLIVDSLGFLIFCPARPEKYGMAGVIDMDQIKITRDKMKFKPLAIYDCKIKMFVGHRKL